MRYHPITILRRHATIGRVVDGLTLQRDARLERWAQCLEAHGGWVTALHRTETVPWRRRCDLAAAGSALDVAYADPLLRAAGLAGARYGAARRFFRLSDAATHEILCDCRSGRLPASAVAARIRRVAHGGDTGRPHALRLALLGAFLTATALAALV